MKNLQSLLSLSAIQSVIRAVLKVGGGYLLAKGLADESAVEAVSAGAVALAAILWGIWHRKDDPAKAPPAALMLLISGSLLVYAAGCSSLNSRTFHAEKLTADTAHTALLAWKSYYAVAVADADPHTRSVLSNHNERVYAASRAVAASLYAVDELRERCLTNSAASNRNALEITLSVAANHASNLVWVVKSFPQ